LNFENTGQPGPDATYYYRYDFKINSTALSDPTFWPATSGGLEGTFSGGALTTNDIQYSFQRSLVEDRLGGPQWMLDEPLLDNSAGLSLGLGGLAALGYGYTAGNVSYTQMSEVGKLISNAVQCNSTDVWFNIMYPGAYGPLMQILTQTWASIESEAWINTVAIGEFGRPDWNGQINASLPSEPANTAWYNNWLGAGLSPLDTPSFIVYGSGPFIMTTIDLTNNYWSATRYVNYWRGWPASFPKEANAAPAGYVNTIEVTWNFVWGTRLTMFLDGDCDFCALGEPSQIPQLYTTQTGGLGYPFSLKPPGNTNYPLPGLQALYPLPELEVDAMFFTFNINSATDLQTLGTPGSFNPITFHLTSSA